MGSRKTKERWGHDGEGSRAGLSDRKGGRKIMEALVGKKGLGKGGENKKDKVGKAAEQNRLKQGTHQQHTTKPPPPPKKKKKAVTRNRI